MKELAVMANIMRIMKDVTPTVAKSVAEYLVKKDQNSYNRMEVTLKAAGFTVEQFFRSLEENTSNQEFIESFRRTSALAAQEEIIKNSTEIPDIEKIKMLDRLHEKEVKQQARALEEIRQKRRDNFQYAVGILMGIGLLTSKTVGPYLMKSSNKLIKASTSALKSITKKG